MRKNAFTLIELLGVLMILAIIAVITIPIINNILSNSREQAYQRSVEGIIEAARLYVTSEGKMPSATSQNLTLDDLIASGFLEDKDIIDPRDNSQMTGCVVYTWDTANNQYIYSYEEVCVITPTLP